LSVADRTSAKHAPTEVVIEKSSRLKESQRNHIALNGGDKNPAVTAERPIRVPVLRVGMSLKTSIRSLSRSMLAVLYCCIWVLASSSLSSDMCFYYSHLLNSLRQKPLEQWTGSPPKLTARRRTDKATSAAVRVSTTRHSRKLKWQKRVGAVKPRPVRCVPSISEAYRARTTD
jgi:hypothetical protein